LADKPLVIGLTGPFGSGKTTAANFFAKYGYEKIVLSSFLAEELQGRGKETTRKNLQDVGNELRKVNGSGYLVERALEFIQKNKIKKATVDGIRNLGEIEALRNKTQLVLLGLVADRDVRFNRVRKMKGREKLTREMFEHLDKRDLGIIEENKQGLQVAKCLALADYFVESNDEEAYPTKLSVFLKKL
jgi:dephospho-CoA kinase